MLEEKVPLLINYIKNYKPLIDQNSILINISNGDLLRYVQESLKEELNPRAYNISKNRIPPINIIKKLQIKLSKVYGEAPVRNAGDNIKDGELYEKYITDWDLNNNMQYANELLVINKYCALEPYMDDGEAQLRVLSAKDFIVYSDSKVNPNKPTVFIKFMGSITKEEPKTSPSSNSQYKEVALFHAYSNDEFIIFDEEGQVYEVLPNPVGVIPFVYIRTNTNELIPTPDSDLLPMSLLIPKLLTDLNYATMFSARSQIVAMDVDIPANLEFSPDSLWVLNSEAGENKNPSITALKSDVDIDKVIELINTQLGLFLDTRGISTGSIGKATVQNAVSGISKLIDESDASSVNRSLKKNFQVAEKGLFNILPNLHESWIRTNETKDLRVFSSKYNPSTILSDEKIVPNIKEILEELKLMKELGIFTVESALKKLYPDLGTQEIQTLINEINEESDSKLSIIFPEQDKEDKGE